MTKTKAIENQEFKNQERRLGIISKEIEDVKEFSHKPSNWSGRTPKQVIRDNQRIMNILFGG